jgi:hypothetical protein
MGIKSSASSLGGVVGPLLAAVVARLMVPQSAFIVSIAVVVFGALSALIVLQEPRQAGETEAV